MVYPGHGAGSACGKSIGKGHNCTIGKQKVSNYALQTDLKKEEFVKKLTAEIPTPPEYFFEAARMNKEGYANVIELVKKATTPLAFDKFNAEVEKGAIIIDSRKVEDCETVGLIPNSINLSFEFPIAVWLGNILSGKDKYVLITENGKEKEVATRFARVGFENLLGYLDGGVDTWTKNKSMDKLECIQAVNAKELLGKV